MLILCNAIVCAHPLSCIVCALSVAVIRTVMRWQKGNCECTSFHLAVMITIANGYDERDESAYESAIPL